MGTGKARETSYNGFRALGYKESPLSQKTEGRRVHPQTFPIPVRGMKVTPRS